MHLIEVQVGLGVPAVLQPALDEQASQAAVRRHRYQRFPRAHRNQRVETLLTRLAFVVGRVGVPGDPVGIGGPDRATADVVGRAEGVDGDQDQVFGALLRVLVLILVEGQVRFDYRCCIHLAKGDGVDHVRPASRRCDEIGMQRLVARHLGDRLIEFFSVEPGPGFAAERRLHISPSPQCRAAPRPAPRATANACGSRPRRARLATACTCRG